MSKPDIEYMDPTDPNFLEAKARIQAAAIAISDEAMLRLQEFIVRDPDRARKGLFMSTEKDPQKALDFAKETMQRQPKPNAVIQ